MSQTTTQASPDTTSTQTTHRIFICGSALRGQPDHDNLQSATFLGATRTQARYRLHAAEAGWHPAIYEVAEGGISIPGEIYELTAAQFEYLLAHEPPHMYPADVVTEDGTVLTAMLYPQALVERYGWEDISCHGGWAAYKAAAE
ncbi:gamma-glutamylcyclotransferase [Leptolyngbya sp. PCC 6406]|uniref:allophanate hydrolase-related protein n=1 Tax=Leptolyngbya sp. PCC 6406 TaxID=1173264 RepID=UPI0002AC2DF4|nr:gamma-glutamylcyclotransferase [Leptolyngbya sp. PCC 6406]